MKEQPLGELIALLSHQAKEIHKLENLASALAEDPEQGRRYKAVLEEKARLLSSLAQRGLPLTKKMPHEHGSPIQHTLNQFSQSATTSIRIGSPFYMSALLYPQNHEKGEPNDLEVFIHELRNLKELTNTPKPD